jgi:hypothetical protein
LFSTPNHSKELKYNQFGKSWKVQSIYHKVSIGSQIQHIRWSQCQKISPRKKCFVGYRGAHNSKV